jgi:hypothetical protein
VNFFELSIFSVAMDFASFEKFDGHPNSWWIFRKKVAVQAIKYDELHRSKCHDIIRYAEILYRLKGRKPADGSQDETFLASMTSSRDTSKKKSAQNLMYSFLAMSSIDTCPGIVCSIDERSDTCGSDLWIQFLSAFEPRPRSFIEIICSMLYKFLACIVWLIILIFQNVFLILSLILGFVLLAIEIVLQILLAFVEALHILGIPRLRQATLPR